MLTIRMTQRPLFGCGLFFETSQVNHWAEPLANNVPCIESNAEILVNLSIQLNTTHFSIMTRIQKISKNLF